MRKLIKILCGSLFLASAVLHSVVGFTAASLADRYLVSDPASALALETDLLSVVGEEDRQVLASGNTSSGITLGLWGIIPVKEIRLETAEAKTVLMSGIPFGVKMYTDGVVVIETNPITSADGIHDPGRAAGILCGDVITEINGEKISDMDHFSALMQKNGSRQARITVVRSNMIFTVTLEPAQDEADGKYKAGLWVRDSSAGIGTMTYYDPATHIFGGLGHGICDVDTKELLPLASGEIVPVTLTGVVKGTAGLAGELHGKFSGKTTIGTLTANTLSGVFGKADGEWSGGEPITVAFKQEVHTGACRIYTTIDESGPSFYDAEISEVDASGRSGKNMVIRITDPALLEKTGGIVQGMSGSPIIQDGKLVGAVTHVLVNDPTTGYGIFIENMMDAAE